jgi:hypothetical protein
MIKIIDKIIPKEDKESTDSLFFYSNKNLLWFYFVLSSGTASQLK